MGSAVDLIMKGRGYQPRFIYEVSTVLDNKRW